MRKVGDANRNVIAMAQICADIIKKLKSPLKVCCLRQEVTKSQMDQQMTSDLSML